MEDFDYMACMGLFADGFEEWPRVVAALHAVLAGAPQLRGGVSLLSRNGCVVRFLARSASDMTGMNKKLGDAARKLLLRMTPFDYRKF